MQETSVNNKILSLSYLIAGALAALVINILITAFAPLTSGAVAKVLTGDFVTHVLPVVVGLGTFAVLQFSKSVNVWGDEVVTEVKRIVWPSRRDTTAMTIVVCLMVVFAGILFFFFDYVSSLILTYLIKLG